MNMLSSQCYKLRSWAGQLSEREDEFGVVVRALVADLREAADTIESMRKQVAKCQIAELKADYDTSRHFELFGTPERAARTLHSCCAKCWCNDCTTCRLAEFMGYKGDEHALLGWLRGDAE